MHRTEPAIDTSRDAAPKSEARAATLKNAVAKARRIPCRVEKHPTEPRAYLVTSPENHTYTVRFELDSEGKRQAFCNCETDNSKYCCYPMVHASIADSYETSYPPVDSLLFAEYVVRVKSREFKGLDFHASEEWTRIRLMVNAPQLAYRKYGRRAEARAA